jgi:formate hydrogenlyase subunit 3/multisubunit Na+/H+ antiporter MnhD subunit
MVELIDVMLPIITLVIAALLTIPVFRFIRKSTNKTALTLGWFIAIFAIAGATVANLALNYYSTGSNPGILSLGLTSASSSMFSSAFMIDAISIYMSIIIVAISAVVVVYTVFALGSNERPSERYFAIMLMTTAGLLGAVLAGDLLTFFIFWEAATAGAAFLMLYKKNVSSLQCHLKVSYYGHHRFRLHNFWVFTCLRANRNFKLLSSRKRFNTFNW